MCEIWYSLISKCSWYIKSPFLLFLTSWKIILPVKNNGAVQQRNGTLRLHPTSPFKCKSDMTPGTTSWRADKWVVSSDGGPTNELFHLSMTSLALTWTLFLRRANLAICIICCAISLATFTIELFSSSHLSVSSCNSLAASWNNIAIIKKYCAWSVRKVCASFSLQPINTIMSSTKLSRDDTSVCFEFLLACAIVWFQL